MYSFLPVDDGGKSSGSQFTLDDLFQRDFQIHDADAKWISGKYVRKLSSKTPKHSKSDIIPTSGPTIPIIHAPNHL